jgi:hypothetical protein
MWACPVGQVKELNYIGQVFEAIKRPNKWFSDQLPTMICGDFNSNAIFDHARKKRNHTAVVEMLKQRNVLSAYRAFFPNSTVRKPDRPTTFGIGNQDLPY